jgi:transposase
MEKLENREYLLMSKRKISPQDKLRVVLEGMSGKRPLAEICNDYGISQSLYYQWRDKLLSNGDKVFKRGGIDKEQERLSRENRKLKETIGELTIELKKNDW